MLLEFSEDIVRNVSAAEVSSLQCFTSISEDFCGRQRLFEGSEMDKLFVLVKENS